MSSEVSERALREIYLRPFQVAIREAKPWAVMSSYNRVNGVHASENAYTLLDILKGEWGFEGIVISDCTARTVPTLQRRTGFGNARSCAVDGRPCAGGGQTRPSQRGGD